MAHIFPPYPAVTNSIIIPPTPRSFLCRKLKNSKATPPQTPTQGNPPAWVCYDQAAGGGYWMPPPFTPPSPGWVYVPYGSVPPTPGHPVGIPVTPGRRSPDAWRVTPAVQYEPLYKPEPPFYGPAGKPRAAFSNPWASPKQRAAVMTPSEYNNYHPGASINPRIQYNEDDSPIFLDILFKRCPQEVLDIRGDESSPWGQAAAEFAILPRSTDIRLVTPLSSWDVTIHKSSGVTLADLIRAIYDTYNAPITSAEWAQIPQGEQTKISLAYYKNRSGQPGTPGSTRMPVGLQRADILLDFTCIVGIRQNPSLVRQRYGYNDQTTFELVLESNSG